MRTRLLFPATILSLAWTLLAEPKPSLLQKVYVAPDGLAHVIDIKGKDLAMPKEKEQVGVSTPKLSPDKLTAGWLVQQENCCTSYTIPTSLILYRDGKRRIFGDGQMIYDWCFVGEGSQVAMSTGTVHGMESRHLTLYDIPSGKAVSKCDGAPDATPPHWAKDLQQ
jgi:hypothetical protein